MKESSRCKKVSRAWGCRCDLKKGHAGMCDSAGDGFHGQDPIKEPKPRKTKKQTFGPGTVDAFGLDLGNGTAISVSCKHKTTVACGGCYARLDRAIDFALAELYKVKLPTMRRSHDKDLLRVINRVKSILEKTISLRLAEIQS